MPYAVTLRLSEPAATQIEKVRRALAEQTGDECVVRLGYPPHVTLAVLPDDAPAKAVEDAVFHVVEGWEALPIVLAGVGIFPGPSHTIWAAPAVTERMLAHHGRLLAALSAFAVHPHYHVGTWVPHVTLNQQGQASAVRAVEIALSLWKGPIRGQLDRVDLVRFSPVDLLHSAPLGVAGGT
jgi:2'-5' RNA ligase